jgi:predicted glycosyltransferase
MQLDSAYTMKDPEFKINNWLKEISKWPKKKCINGKSFDRLFKLEGIELSWFYFNLFGPYIIPKPINLTSYIKENKKPSAFVRAKLLLISKLLSKYVVFNEKRKLRKFKKNKSLSKNNKVLFLSYTNHISEENKIFKIQNILDIIRKEKKLNDFVVFAEPLSMGPHNKLLDFNTIYPYYNKKIDKKARKNSSNFYKKIKKISKESKKCLFNFSKGSWTHFEPAFNLYFSKEFLYIVLLYYKIFKNLLKQENIKCVVTTGLGGIHDKSLIAAAHNLKIPVIMIQDGLGSGQGNCKYLTKYVVFSDYSKKMLIKEGVDKNKIIVNGPIIFDQVSKYIGQKKKKQKRVFLATEPFIEDSFLNKDVYLERIKNILKSINKIKGAEIIIKLHPREIHFNEYKKIVDNLGLKNVKIFPGKISRDKFYQLIYDSDVFIHSGSTAAFEAAIIGRPIITLDIIGDHSLTNWIEKHDVTININYHDNAGKAIQEAFKENKEMKKKLDDYVKEHCGNVDGKASQRIVKLLENIIK